MAAFAISAGVSIFMQLVLYLDTANMNQDLAED